ncbi:putative disease resistance RPP13-like protein 1 [Mangifera indica]|uniref:putative disease resistance RPP13-like protein 1 n=1 Tax=Mangifera indica TaxID=29780 RepID=UPI001CFBD908|nr:putative disease resistance RPP13-like protein 1 [Mangifera indica]XP_044490290.1 putative disease resistance RPP13-like protein 1 [Mangifera indica]
MSIIGEAILSVTVEMLIQKLVSEVVVQFGRQEQIHDDLKKWEKTLKKIQAVLDDADEKQMTNRLVKIWLSELQDLAYDLEDILDELATEALRRKLLLLQPQPQPTTTSKLRKLIPNFFTGFSPRSVKFSNMMASKIKEITARLQNIAAEKDSLELRKNSEGGSKKIRERLPTTSLVNEAKVFGREKDKEVIVELLLNVDSCNDYVVGVSVIPITGMGGLGKTTLAKLVYNDKRVENHFDHKVWIHVSEAFDAIRVTKTILQSIDAPMSDDGNYVLSFLHFNDLDNLQVQLKRKLSGKKLLLVLDDVWTQNYNDWTALCSPFESCSPGSKIVVTTRNQGVSSMIKTGAEYSLDKLSDLDCLQVFAQHSLETKDSSVHDHQDLKEIGEKIVKKCDGLPLAAKTLGGLLRGKYDVNDWRDILNSKIWDISEDEGDIMPALKVSYCHLPPRLKQCFAYCSLFPKGYEFQEQKMVLLWMAEGFLDGANGADKMEDLGCKYFRELKSRSFFQKSNSNQSLLVMHDLIHDLAQWAAGKTYLRMEGVPQGDNTILFSNNLRHLSCTGDSLDGLEKLEASDSVKFLRTFLPLTVKKEDRSEASRKRFFRFNYVKERLASKETLPVSLKIFYQILQKSQHLRVLSFHKYCVKVLPDEVGGFKYLRYLDLSYIDIKSLPESVSTMYNLQSLLLEGCASLRKLCRDMGNLINLRHLNILKVNSLEHMPHRIGKLTSLQTLPKFVLGKDVGSGLAELKSLAHLKEKLHISGLENVHDANDAKEADLKGKESLKVLILEWSSGTDDSMQTETQMQVLDLLKPYQKLTELSVIGFCGTKFPIWLGNSTLTKLTSLRLENCGNCACLPSVGHLPLLKELVIKGMVRVKSVGLEFNGNGCLVPFASLETLYFQDMKQWEDWIPFAPGQEVDGFPSLQKLCIVRCSKLNGELPKRLPKLEKLVIEDCKQLSVSVPISPVLSKLEIYGCNEVEWEIEDVGSLKSVELVNVSKPVSIGESFVQGVPKLEELRICGCKDVTFKGMDTHEDISSLHGLSMVEEVEQEQLQKRLPCKLQTLELRDCENLAKLPQALHNLSSLTNVSIQNCPNLASFPEVVGLPSQLRSITIENCKAWGVEALVHGSVTSLESLSISDCESVKYIARVQLPPKLKRLHLEYCNELETLVNKDASKMHEESINRCSSSPNASVLEYLNIRGCESLASLWSHSELPCSIKHIQVDNCPNLVSFSPNGNLPTALEYLRIRQCLKLERIAEKVNDDTSLQTFCIDGCQNLKLLPDCLNKLSRLQTIEVMDCPSFIKFPDGGLPNNLSTLNLTECEKLVALPNGMCHLTSLQDLTIKKCPAIASFPEDGFPTNIRSLEIKDADICKPLFKWGLYRLTSLSKLKISGGYDLESFPQEEIGMKLPASLESLQIENFPNLETLSSSVQDLTSLEQLHLLHCPRLKYFPKKLPSSIYDLYINGCPLLEEKCRKNAEYWPIIAKAKVITMPLR